MIRTDVRGRPAVNSVSPEPNSSPLPATFMNYDITRDWFPSLHLLNDRYPGAFKKHYERGPRRPATRIHLHIDEQKDSLNLLALFVMDILHDNDSTESKEIRTYFNDTYGKVSWETGQHVEPMTKIPESAIMRKSQRSNNVPKGLLAPPPRSAVITGSPFKFFIATLLVPMLKAQSVETIRITPAMAAIVDKIVFVCHGMAGTANAAKYGEFPSSGQEAELLEQQLKLVTETSTNSITEGGFKMLADLYRKKPLELMFDQGDTIQASQLAFPYSVHIGVVNSMDRGQSMRDMTHILSMLDAVYNANFKPLAGDGGKQTDLVQMNKSKSEFEKILGQLSDEAYQRNNIYRTLLNTVQSLFSNMTLDNEYSALKWRRGIERVFGQYVIDDILNPLKHELDQSGLDPGTAAFTNFQFKTLRASEWWAARSTGPAMPTMPWPPSATPWILMTPWVLPLNSTKNTRNRR